MLSKFNCNILGWKTVPSFILIISDPQCVYFSCTGFMVRFLIYLSSCITTVGSFLYIVAIQSVHHSF